MNISPLWKVPLLLGSTACTHISLSSPNPPAKVEEKSQFTEVAVPKARGFQLRDVLPLITKFYKSLSIGINLLEVLNLLLSNAELPEVQRYFPAMRIANVRITPAFLMGLSLVVSGTLLRVQCYRILGRFFTFELTIRDGHELKTDGPYSIVRHPSYTGGLIFMTGLLVSQMGEGSWWKESGIAATLSGKVFGIAWLGTVGVVMSFLVYRTGIEDEALKRRFGKQWEEWATRTRYRLIPYIY
ncbi:hypothetical protein K474DRAFT_1661618 [Panus rudis PR-1116 ss-1]|nr:hypothetical protein K474DRAFT_1661618 [Panus rudis PR-1116 ss-1]